MGLVAPGLTMGILLGAIMVFGNVLSLVSVRAALSGQITPDTYGGIRTAATRSSDAAWYAAHEAAWPWARALNGAAIVFGIATMCLGLTVAPFLVCAALAAALTIAGAVAQIVVGHRAAQRV